jgi:hypothetical protein
MSSLLCAYNMTELNEDFSMCKAYNNSARKYVSLNLNRFVKVRSRYLNAYYVTKSLALLDQVLLNPFNFLQVKKILNGNHVQELNNSTCCSTVLSNRELFIIRHGFMHLNVNVLLQSLTSSLHF